MEKTLLRQITTLQGHITEQVKVLNLCKEIGTSTFYDRDSLYIPHTKNYPFMFTPSLLRKKELLLETRSLLCTINQSFYSGNMPQMKTEICTYFYSTSNIASNNLAASPGSSNIGLCAELSNT